MEGEKREKWLAECKQHVKINRYLSMNVCEFAFCGCSLFVPAWPVYRTAAHCCCAWRALERVLETTEESDTGGETEGSPPPPPPELLHVPTALQRPPGFSPPSLFFLSFLCSSLCLSVCLPALPCMSASCVCHGWIWAWQQRVPVLFFFLQGKMGSGGSDWGGEERQDCRRPRDTVCATMWRPQATIVLQVLASWYDSISRLVLFHKLCGRFRIVILTVNIELWCSVGRVIHWQDLRFYFLRMTEWVQQGANVANVTFNNSNIFREIRHPSWL